MSPKSKVASGPYDVTIIREQNRSNFNLAIDSNTTTFDMLKDMIVATPRLDSSVEVSLHHNGHKTNAGDRILLKNPYPAAEEES